MNKIYTMTYAYEIFFFSAFIAGIAAALILYVHYARKAKRAEAEEIPFERLGKFMVAFAILLIVILTPLSIDPGRNPDPEVITYRGSTALEGWKVAIDYNCMGCHTIVGNGAYYAPELTYVARKAGDGDNIKSLLSAYAGTKFMPFHLSDEEIDALTAWMLYLKDLNTNNWPPMKDNDYSFASSFDKNAVRWYESFDAWLVYWVLTVVFTVFLVFGMFYWYARG
jgi:nitric oxide reductase subunit C